MPASFGSGQFRSLPKIIIFFCLALAGCHDGLPHHGASLPGAFAPVLLFEGKGTSPRDVAAVEAVLDRRGLAYAIADSDQLNRLDVAQLRSYRLLIVPGGNFIDIGNSVTTTATANIRQAVDEGMNYLGLCAGAFFASDSVFNSVNLTSGVRFRFYSAEARGVRKAAVLVTDAQGRALDQYWEDGPDLSGWGDVVARYPDGTPAVAQGAYGKGFVVLSGIHPEAPEAWRRGIPFRRSVRDDNAFAGELIDAALGSGPPPQG